jgi:hypothetical protein
MDLPQSQKILLHASFHVVLVSSLSEFPLLLYIISKITKIVIFGKCIHQGSTTIHAL